MGKINNRLRHWLTALPPWTLSAVCLLAILWLTLAPRPLGDIEPPMFEGADKVVHAIMFGGLTAMLLLDDTRSHRWRPLKVWPVVAAATASAMLGTAIEFMQQTMALGRGFDIFDIVADTAGASAAAILWLMLQHRWSRRNYQQ